MSEKKIVFITWETYGAYVKGICSLIEMSRKKYSAVYGIPRGGLPLATALSHHLDIPLVFDHTKADLIVDDISDSGNTFHDLIKDRKVDTASIFIGESTTFEPTYCIVEAKDDVWISFPYERYGSPDTISKVTEND